MAVTQNSYTGNGSTVLYSFTFPYLDAADVKVSLNDVVTTAYTFANATTIQFNTAPGSGVVIRIYRVTDDAALAATFFPGSAIRSQDLNENFTQNLYVTQESNRDAFQAITASESATTTSNTALSNSLTAISTANTASSNASSAVSTANSAASDAANAVSTANSASAVAASAASDAASAVSTANTASSNASTAVSAANTASSTANTALSLVNSVVSYDPIADVASIPASPNDGDRIEVLDSTGIQSFSPLTGLPSGFSGANNISVRLVYDDPNTTWTWVDYSPTDPDARYLRLTGGTLTGALTLNSDPSANLQAATKQYVDNLNSAGLNTKLSLTGGTLTGPLTLSGAPTTDLEPATKKYVDDANTSQNTAISGKLPLVGGTMTGDITFNAGQTFPGVLPLSGGTLTGDITFNGTQSFPGVLPLTGGTMAGDITFNAGQAFPGVLPLSGGTMTGNITFNAGQTIDGYTPRTSTTGSAVLPSGTELERDGSPAAGYIRFNTDVDQFEGYNGTTWSSVGGGATGGGGDQVFIENDQTVTTNYTITTGKNAVTAGPVSIDSGVTVTIPSGSSWVVV